MRTMQRLTRTYENAIIRTINKDSKFVFISDAHRGDGQFADEFTKNRNTFIHALNYYFHTGFTYVEAGDGDELWEANQMRTIYEAHTDALSAMKRFYDQDRMIMLYGNHNIYLRNEDYLKEHYYQYFNAFTESSHDLFPGLKAHEALILRDEESGQEIFVVHGHQGDLANDQLWYLTMLSVKYFWRFLNSFGIKSPVSPVKNVYKRHKIEKNYLKWIEEHRKMLICGHTHRFKFPRENELPYFNTGCCVYPTTITAIELDRSEISLVRWKTVPNESGVLQIQRMVLMGPKPISEFDLRDTSAAAVETLADESVRMIHTKGSRAVEDEDIQESHDDQEGRK